MDMQTVVSCKNPILQQHMMTIVILIIQVALKTLVCYSRCSKQCPFAFTHAHSQTVDMC